MNRFEKSDVPFVPSQIAQPEGGSIVTLPSAPRLNAEGGGNQAITVLAGMSEALAPVMAAIVTSPPFAGQYIRWEHHTYTRLRLM
jgi:hypothetical protein